MVSGYNCLSLQKVVIFLLVTALGQGEALECFNTCFGAEGCEDASCSIGNGNGNRACSGKVEFGNVVFERPGYRIENCGEGESCRFGEFQAIRVDDSNKVALVTTPLGCSNDDVFGGLLQVNNWNLQDITMVLCNESFCNNPPVGNCEIELESKGRENCQISEEEFSHTFINNVRNDDCEIIDGFLLESGDDSACEVCESQDNCGIFLSEEDLPNVEEPNDSSDSSDSGLIIVVLGSISGVLLLISCTAMGFLTGSRRSKTRKAEEDIFENIPSAIAVGPSELNNPVEQPNDFEEDNIIDAATSGFIYERDVSLLSELELKELAADDDSQADRNELRASLVEALSI